MPWAEHVNNIEVLSKTEKIHILTIIRKQLIVLGHMRRKSSLNKVVLTGYTESSKGEIYNSEDTKQSCVNEFSNREL